MKGREWMAHNTVRFVGFIGAVASILMAPSASVAQPCLGSGCIQPALEWRFAPRIKADGTPRRCPSRYGIPDISCDDGVRVVIVGDSIVAGVGDERFGNAGGGYVTRIQESLPRVVFSGFGTPGQNSEQLYKKVKTALAKRSPSSELGQALVDADIIIIDVGRNDWFEVFKLDEPPSLPTYTRLRRLQSHVRARLTLLTGRTPLVVLLSSCSPIGVARGRGFRSSTIGLLKRAHRTSPQTCPSIPLAKGSITPIGSIQLLGGMTRLLRYCAAT